MKRKYDILWVKEYISLPVVRVSDAGMPSWCPFQGQCPMFRTILGSPGKSISIRCGREEDDDNIILRVRDIRPAAKNFCMFCDDGLPYHMPTNSCRAMRKYITGNKPVSDMQRLTGGLPGTYDFAAVRYAVYVGHAMDPRRKNKDNGNQITWKSLIR